MAALRGHATRDLESEPEVARHASGYVLIHGAAGYAGPHEIGAR